MAFRVAQNLTAGKPLTLSRLTPVVLSYSDMVASIPARHRYLSLNSALHSIGAALGNTHRSCHRNEGNSASCLALPDTADSWDNVAQ